jgi:MFS transporter, LPLT family, lysophospholipid transporter
MNGSQVRSDSVLSRGMVAVLVAQFLSALADNALLFGAVALLRLEHFPEWTQPLLQEFFVGAYILLAPFAGPFADALPKGQVMFVSNGLKLVGALGILVGVNPFVAYGLVGVGAAVSICYGVAALVNLLIPRLAPAHRLERFGLLSLMGDFWHAFRRLSAVPDVRFSVAGTSLFWGAGSTMRFLLIAWVPVALGITNIRTPAYLNAVVAVGIVFGAALASKAVTLEKVTRAMPGGVLIGVAVCVLAFTTHLPLAFAVLTFLGACGGFFIVPLNALLQARGHESVGAGHAIAVQNLIENLAMLFMIGGYMLAMRAGAPVTRVAAGFGGFLAVAMVLLWVYRVRKVAERRANELTQLGKVF